MSDSVSIKQFNQWSQEYQITKDDGDGIPTGRDTYTKKQDGSIVPFDVVASDVIGFYKQQDSKLVRIESGFTRVSVGKEKGFIFKKDDGYCTYIDSKSENFYKCSASSQEGWTLQAGTLKEFLPENSLSHWNIEFDRDPAYYLASTFSYQPPESVDQFVEFVESAPIPLADLQVMERTAKARGNVQLGNRLHSIFEKRNQGNDFVRLDITDRWGDSIYLQRGSKSEKAWQLAQTRLSEQGDRDNFAKALSHFSSVEIDERTNTEVLQRFLVEVPKYYEAGIPSPRNLRIIQGKKYSGHYDGSNDTVTMNKWDRGTYKHELGHFVMDLMNDTRGPNMGFQTIKHPDGSLMFNPNHCNLHESVSEYGGQCDQERLDRTSKKNEDPAETFSYALSKKLGEPFEAYASFSSRLANDLPNVLGRAIVRLKESGKPLVDSDKKTLQSLSTMLHETAGNTHERPPKHSGDDSSYIKALEHWVGELSVGHHDAKQVKEEKIKWMTRAVDLMTPKKGEPHQPNPNVHPWEIPSILTSNK
jgi:hypothetical protein